jgi:hypothetical protein
MEIADSLRFRSGHRYHRQTYSRLGCIMAIGPCPECGGKVSTTAVSCPHCGNTAFRVPTGKCSVVPCDVCRGEVRKSGCSGCNSCNGKGKKIAHEYRDSRDGSLVVGRYDPLPTFDTFR